MPMVLQNTNRNRSAWAADVENPSQALDVGLEQRRRVTQIEAGVHHAVEDHVAVGDGLRQRCLVAQVAVAAFDLEVVDRHRVGRLAQVHPNVVAAFDELAGDVGADEPRRPHHEDLAAGRLRAHEAFLDFGGE